MQPGSNSHTMTGHHDSLALRDVSLPVRSQPSSPKCSRMSGPCCGKDLCSVSASSPSHLVVQDLAQTCAQSQHLCSLCYADKFEKRVVQKSASQELASMLSSQLCASSGATAARCDRLSRPDACLYIAMPLQFFLQCIEELAESPVLGEASQTRSSRRLPGATISHMPYLGRLPRKSGWDQYLED